MDAMLACEISPGRAMRHRPGGPADSTSVITAGSMRGKCDRAHVSLLQIRRWPPSWTSVGAPQVPQNRW